MLPLEFELDESVTFSLKEVRRLRKLEFVHKIGLIPILKMGNDANNEMEETTVVKFPSASKESQDPPVLEMGGEGGGSEVSDDDASELLSVNTNDSTEVENSEDDNSTASTSFSFRSPGEDKNRKEGRRESSQPEKTPSTRKTCEELAAENQELSRLLESKNQKITEIKKNHEAILEENKMLSLELQDIENKTTEEQKLLEENLQTSVKTKEILQQKICTMRNGIRDMNRMLFELITQLNYKNNADQVPPTHSEELRANASAVVPYVPPVTNPPPPKVSKSQASTNIVKVALERMAPKMIEAATSKILSRSKHQDLAGASSSKTQLIQRPLLHAVDRDREDKGFFCICGACLTTKLGLMTHINYHTFEGQFRCTVKDCKKRFFATGTLRQHMKAKHGIVYKGREGCRKCGETFVSRMQLYLHCKNIHNCGPLCAQRKGPGSAISSRRSTLHAFPKPPPRVVKKPSSSRNSVGNQTYHEMDISRTDTDASLYVCTCGGEFVKKRNLLRHIRYIYCEPKFSCKVCGNKYKGTNLLRQHMKMKHNVTYDGNGCRACGRVFQTRFELYQHRKTVHNIGPFCNDMSPQPQPQPIPIILEEVEHVAPTHSKRQRKTPLKYIEESERYSVQQSNKQTPKQKLGTPIHAVDPNRLEEFRCICGKSFSKRPALLGHIQFKTMLGIFPCPVCKRRFPRRNILKNHVTSTHPTYDISQDQNISALVNQTRKRRQTKTPVLAVPRQSSSSPALPPHGVAISNRETKEYKCLCGLEFKRTETLREHIRLKMELTQFKCDFCQDTFWRHDYLKLHLQRAHDVVTSGFACRICGCSGFSSLQDVKYHRSVYHNKADGNQDPLLAIPWKR